MARKVDGKVQVTFYMLPKQHEELKQAAAAAKKTMGDFIVETVDRRVEEVLDVYAVARSTGARKRILQKRR